MSRVLANGPVELYQRLKKSYLILPSLTLRNIRYWSRVKWSNPGEGVTPPTSRRSSYLKREPTSHPRLCSSTLLFFIFVIN